MSAAPPAPRCHRLSPPRLCRPPCRLSRPCVPPALLQVAPCALTMFLPCLLSYLQLSSHLPSQWPSKLHAQLPSVHPLPPPPVPPLLGQPRALLAQPQMAWFLRAAAPPPRRPEICPTKLEQAAAQPTKLQKRKSTLEGWLSRRLQAPDSSHIASLAIRSADFTTTSLPTSSSPLPNRHDQSCLVFPHPRHHPLSPDMLKSRSLFIDLALSHSRETSMMRILCVSAPSRSCAVCSSGRLLPGAPIICTTNQPSAKIFSFMLPSPALEARGSCELF